MPISTNYALRRLTDLRLPSQMRALRGGGSAIIGITPIYQLVFQLLRIARVPSFLIYGESFHGAELHFQPMRLVWELRKLL